MEYENEPGAVTWGARIGSGGMAAGADAKRLPLTNEILENTRGALGLAREVRNRLSDLRDRLFGPDAETGGLGSAARPVADNFASTFADVAEELSYNLNQIDRLTAQLSNRL